MQGLEGAGGKGGNDVNIVLMYDIPKTYKNRKKDRHVLQDKGLMAMCVGEYQNNLG